MECYYFTGSKYGLDNLKRKRLKVSNIDNLNDPFEMLGVKLSSKNVRRQLLEVKQAIASRYGILCFSRSWSNPVQWGHYAENHKGLCLVFDVPNSDLREINYIANRINPSSINLESEAAAYTLMTTKFNHWHYEKEHRVIYLLGSLLNENGLFFKEFGDDLKLKKVIIGSHSPMNKAKIQLIVGKRIEVFHAKLHDSEYKIDRDKTR